MPKLVYPNFSQYLQFLRRHKFQNYPHIFEPPKESISLKHADESIALQHAISSAAWMNWNPESSTPLPLEVSYSALLAPDLIPKIWGHIFWTGSRGRGVGGCRRGLCCRWWAGILSLVGSGLRGGIEPLFLAMRLRWWSIIEFPFAAAMSELEVVVEVVDWKGFLVMW